MRITSLRVSCKVVSRTSSISGIPLEGMRVPGQPRQCLIAESDAQTLIHGQNAFGHGGQDGLAPRRFQLGPLHQHARLPGHPQQGAVQRLQFVDAQTAEHARAGCVVTGFQQAFGETSASARCGGPPAARAQTPAPARCAATPALSRIVSLSGQFEDDARRRQRQSPSPEGRTRTGAGRSCSESLAARVVRKIYANTAWPRNNCNSLQSTPIQREFTAS